MGTLGKIIVASLLLSAIEHIVCTVSDSFRETPPPAPTPDKE